MTLKIKNSWKLDDVDLAMYLDVSNARNFKLNLKLSVPRRFSRYRIIIDGFCNSSLLFTDIRFQQFYFILSFNFLPYVFIHKGFFMFFCCCCCCH